MSQGLSNDNANDVASSLKWDGVETAWESHYCACAICQKLEADGTLEEAIPIALLMSSSYPQSITPKPRFHKFIATLVRRQYNLIRGKHRETASREASERSRLDRKFL